MNPRPCAGRSTATHAGQAQKEVTVNEALTASDLLLHPAVLGERADPPATSAPGDAWLVGAGATGEWTGHDGALAGWTDGGWRLISPQPGMRVYDASSGAFRLFDTGWTLPSAPALPQGGTTIDTEARLTIGDIVAILRDVGIFPAV